MLFKRALLALIFAATAMLASSAIPGHVHEVDPGSMGCQQGCEHVAGGWPFPYLVDDHGLSPVNSVDLFGAIFGVDHVRPGAMVATFLFWLALLIAVDRIARMRSRSKE